MRFNQVTGNDVRLMLSPRQCDAWLLHLALVGETRIRNRMMAGRLYLERLMIGIL